MYDNGFQWIVCWLAALFQVPDDKPINSEARWVVRKRFTSTVRDENEMLRVIKCPTNQPGDGMIKIFYSFT